MPSATPGSVIDQARSTAPAVAVPTTTEPRYSVTSEPASALPVKVGDVSSVMSSVLDAPLSLPAARSGTEGAASGAATSLGAHTAACCCPSAVYASPATSPKLLMSYAWLATPPSVPRSTISPTFVHTNACRSPELVVLYPTTRPMLFTAEAELVVPPSVPRSTIGPPTVHENAWVSPDAVVL